MKISQLVPAFQRYMLFEREVTPNSIKCMVRALRMLKAHAGHENVKAMDTKTIREFLYETKVTRMWSPKTFRNYRQYLASFFNWCEREDFIKTNPVSKIEKPKLPKLLPRHITSEDAKLILAVSFDMSWLTQYERYRNHAIVATFLFTGIRHSELLNLTLDDVNLKTDEIFIRQGKNKKDRIVPVYNKLKPILEHYLTQRSRLKHDSKWFFASLRSEAQMNQKTVQAITKRIAKESGVFFTPHMLRHTFGRLSANSGFGLYQTKEIMGHSSVTTTQRYSSISLEALKQLFSETELL